MFLLEILKNAERGVESLNHSAVEKLHRFILSLDRGGGGGFAGLAAACEGDIYYTPFALMALSVLGSGAKFAENLEFADSVTCFDSLDLAHLASLARMEALIAVSRSSDIAFFTPPPEREPRREYLIDALEKFRSKDGGFSHFAKFAENATPYGVFLAANALDELGASPEAPAKFADILTRQRLPDGSYSNSRNEGLGTLNATAAAVAVLAETEELDENGRRETADFIRSMESSLGGFKAVADAPLPDILSTSAALFSLRVLGVELNGKERSRHLEFVRDHWRETSDAAAGFAGAVASETSDAEYTFHALLALGLLSS